MKRRDDYVSGPGHYWVQFICGLIFGFGFGAWAGAKTFDTMLSALVTASVTALAVALACGHLGDEAWEVILKWFHWI